MLKTQTPAVSTVILFAAGFALFLMDYLKWPGWTRAAMAAAVACLLAFGALRLLGKI